ncbi:MAG: hypothetical protein ACI89X_003163 [Planctomycetota bacterium]|jgi:hypothetical protein
MTRFAKTVLLLAALSSAAAAQDASPSKPQQIPFAGLANLELEFSDAGLHARIQGPNAGFLGVVLLSDSFAQTHFPRILPPLLSNYVVMGFGFARGEHLELWNADAALGKLTKVYGQAVTFDGVGIGASGLVPLDPKAGKADAR